MSILLVLPILLFGLVAVISAAVPLLIELQLRRAAPPAQPVRARPRLVVIQGGGKPVAARKSRMA